MWHARAVTVGSADTKKIAKYISQSCTLTEADVQAVLTALPGAMAHYMSAGLSINLQGLGSFYYTADTTGRGVATADEVTPEQIKGVHVRFIPSGSRQSNGQYSERPLVARDIEWIEL